MSLVCHSIDFSPLRTSPRKWSRLRQRSHTDGSTGPPPPRAPGLVLPGEVWVLVLLPLPSGPHLENWQWISNASMTGGQREVRTLRIQRSENIRQLKYDTKNWELFFPLDVNVCVFSLENKITLTLPRVLRLQPVGCSAVMTVNTGPLLSFSQSPWHHSYLRFGLSSDFYNNKPHQSS